MYLIRQNEVVNEWVHAHAGGRAAHGTYQAFGWLTDGKLSGGVVFHTCNGWNCYANIAVTSPHALRPILRVGLPYAFAQLALPRLTFAVSSANLASITLVTGLGATREATLHGAGDSGEDMYIYCLRPETCPIWSRMWESRVAPRRGQITQP